MLDKIYVTIRKEIECSEEKIWLYPLKFNLAGNIQNYQEWPTYYYEIFK